MRKRCTGAFPILPSGFLPRLQLYYRNSDALTIVSNVIVFIVPNVSRNVAFLSQAIYNRAYERTDSQADSSAGRASDD